MVAFRCRAQLRHENAWALPVSKRLAYQKSFGLDRKFRYHPISSQLIASRHIQQLVARASRTILSALFRERGFRKLYPSSRLNLLKVVTERPPKQGEAANALDLYRRKKKHNEFPLPSRQTKNLRLQETHRA